MVLKDVVDDYLKSEKVFSLHVDRYQLQEKYNEFNASYNGRSKTNSEKAIKMRAFCVFLLTYPNSVSRHKVNPTLVMNDYVLEMINNEVCKGTFRH